MMVYPGIFMLKNTSILRNRKHICEYQIYIYIMLKTVKQMQGMTPLEVPMEVPTEVPMEVQSETMKGSTGRNIREPTVQVSMDSHLMEEEPIREFVYRLEEDDGMLVSELDTTSRSTTSQVNIQLCVYHICPPIFGSATSFPHVQMMMEPLPAPVDVGSVGAAFAPHTVGWMTVDELISRSIESDQESDQDSIRAVNACIEHILLTYPGNNMQDFEFKGWLYDESDPSATVVVGVFCAKNKKTDIDAWANLDEIMYQASWRGVPVDPFVTRLVHQHSFLSEIVDTHTRLPIPSPMSLYLCNTRTHVGEDSWGGGTYTNMLRDSTLCIEPTIEHPLFGNHWYFSGMPIGDTNTIQRYSVFVEDPLTHALFRDIRDGLTDADRTYLTQKYIGQASLMPTEGSGSLMPTGDQASLMPTEGSGSLMPTEGNGSLMPTEGSVEGDWPVKTTFFHEGGVPIWCIRDRHAFVRI